MDRRADPRIDVTLRCHALFAGSKSRIYVGLTQNISRSGLLLTWDENLAASTLPSLGDPLTVEIELPANRSFGSRCMRCEAVVTRVEAAPGAPRTVALRIEQMAFRSAIGRGSGAARADLGCSVM